MVLNQHDLTLNLVLFEPGSESTSGWKLGILLHQRDEAPTTEMLSRLYGELANLEMAFKCPKFLEDLLEIRAQDTNHG